MMPGGGGFGGGGGGSGGGNPNKPKWGQRAGGFAGAQQGSTSQQQQQQQGGNPTAFSRAGANQGWGGWGSATGGNQQQQQTVTRPTSSWGGQQQRTSFGGGTTGAAASTMPSRAQSLFKRPGPVAPAPTQATSSNQVTWGRGGGNSDAVQGFQIPGGGGRSPLKRGGRGGRGQGPGGGGGRGGRGGGGGSSGAQSTWGDAGGRSEQRPQRTRQQWRTEANQDSGMEKDDADMVPTTNAWGQRGARQKRTMISSAGGGATSEQDDQVGRGYTTTITGLWDTPSGKGGGASSSKPGLFSRAGIQGMGGGIVDDEEEATPPTMGRAKRRTTQETMGGSTSLGLPWKKRGQNQRSSTGDDGGLESTQFEGTSGGGRGGGRRSQGGRGRGFGQGGRAIDQSGQRNEWRPKVRDQPAVIPSEAPRKADGTFANRVWVRKDPSVKPASFVTSNANDEEEEEDEGQMEDEEEDYNEEEEEDGGDDQQDDEEEQEDDKQPPPPLFRSPGAGNTMSNKKSNAFGIKSSPGGGGGIAAPPTTSSRSPALSTSSPNHTSDVAQPKYRLVVGDAAKRTLTHFIKRADNSLLRQLLEKSERQRGVLRRRPRGAAQSDTSAAMEDGVEQESDEGEEEMAMEAPPEIRGELIAGAKSLVGTCLQMCPAIELDETRRGNALHALEQRPGLPLSETVIKDLDRDPHGGAVPPELVRPLDVLFKTVVYLEDNLMDKNRGDPFDPDPSWQPKVTPLEIYLFMFDRLRMVAKELTMQNYAWGGNLSMPAITILERMVRYFVVYSHRLNNDAIFTSQHARQNRNQVVGHLKHLLDLYKYAYSINQPGFCVNEPEFRAYAMLVTNDDQVGLPPYTNGKVSDSPEVLFALKVIAAVRAGNSRSFFRCLEAAPYLDACLMGPYIPEMREVATMYYDKAFTTTKGPEFNVPIADFMSKLGMITVEELEAHCERYNLEIRPDNSVGFRRQVTTQMLPNNVYVPFIEQKAEGLRIRELTRREKGAFPTTRTALAAADVPAVVVQSPLSIGQTIREPSVQTPAKIPLPTPRKSPKGAGEAAGVDGTPSVAPSSPAPYTPLQAPAVVPTPARIPAENQEAERQRQEAEVRQQQQLKAAEQQKQQAMLDQLRRQQQDAFLQEQRRRQQQWEEQTAAAKRFEQQQQQQHHHHQQNHGLLATLAYLYAQLQSLQTTYMLTVTSAQYLALRLRYCIKSQQHKLSRFGHILKKCARRRLRNGFRYVKTARQRRLRRQAMLQNSAGRFVDTMYQWLRRRQLRRIKQGMTNFMTVRAQKRRDFRENALTIMENMDECFANIRAAPRRRSSRSPLKPMESFNSANTPTLRSQGNRLQLELPNIVGPRYWHRHVSEQSHLLDRRDGVEMLPKAVFWKLLLHAPSRNLLTGWLAGQVAPDCSDPSSPVLSMSSYDLIEEDKVFGQLNLVVANFDISGDIRGDPKGTNAFIYIIDLDEPSPEAWAAEKAKFIEHIRALPPSVPVLILVEEDIVAAQLAALQRRQVEVQDSRPIEQVVASLLGMDKNGHFLWRAASLPSPHKGRLQGNPEVHGELVESLEWLVDNSSLNPLITRSTMTTVLEESVSYKLWKEVRDKRSRDMSMEGCINMVNAGLTEVEGLLCSDDSLFCAFPIPEMAQDISVPGGASLGIDRRAVPGALWLDVMGLSSALPLDWNCPERIVAMEGYLRDLHLPQPGPMVHELMATSPVDALQAYLQSLQEDKSWMPREGVINHLLDLAGTTALTDRGSPVVPWNRIFTELMRERISMDAVPRDLQVVYWPRVVRPLPERHPAFPLSLPSSILESEQYGDVDAQALRETQARTTWTQPTPAKKRQWVEEQEEEKGERTGHTRRRLSPDRYGDDENIPVEVLDSWARDGMPMEPSPEMAQLHMDIASESLAWTKMLLMSHALLNS